VLSVYPLIQPHAPTSKTRKTIYVSLSRCQPTRYSLVITNNPPKTFYVCYASSPSPAARNERILDILCPSRKAASPSASASSGIHHHDQAICVSPAASQSATALVHLINPGQSCCCHFNIHHDKDLYLRFERCRGPKSRAEQKIRCCPIENMKLRKVTGETKTWFEPIPSPLNTRRGLLRWGS